ncbi:MAG: RNA polymerase sigma factor [Bacteroidales bacterium]|jgi:RNA polymerase sigma-70 factor (ECF subfamily)|nr:RNA polymerase sigma factor [Bacteroidales bacterium]
MMWFIALSPEASPISSSTVLSGRRALGTEFCPKHTADAITDVSTEINNTFLFIEVNSWTLIINRIKVLKRIKQGQLKDRTEKLKQVNSGYNCIVVLLTALLLIILKFHSVIVTKSDLKSLIPGKDLKKSMQMDFDDLYRKHYRELKRFCNQLNNTAEQSEDLVQDTFLKLYLEISKNVKITHPRAWLYKVVLNSWKTRLAGEKREKQALESAGNNEIMAFDLQNKLLNSEKQEIIIKILDTLPDNVREILMLYNNGFMYAEIAQIMDINPASVGKRIVRAIEKLKGILKLNYHELFEQN